MTPRLGICTDSSTQLPEELAARYGIEVVPVTLTVGDVERLDRVELGADDFYAARLDPATVVASAPSPGQFALAYEELLSRGCTEILSVHGPAPVNGLVHAARLAAHCTPAPVRLVEAATNGAGVACCTWAAAEAASAGGRATDAAAAAEQVVLRLARFDLRACHHPHASLVDAVNDLVARVLALGPRLRVVVGHTDATAQAVADAIHAAVGEAANVLDVARYRIGPSAGCDAVPGLASCLAFTSE